jgi:hypothetical protein
MFPSTGHVGRSTVLSSVQPKRRTGCAVTRGVPTTVHDASTVGGSSGTVMSALMNEFMARDSPSFSRLFEPVHIRRLSVPHAGRARAAHTCARSKRPAAQCWYRAIDVASIILLLACVPPLVREGNVIAQYRSRRCRVRLVP